MPGKRLGHFVLQLLVTGVCVASAQGDEEVYPDAGFLEYLASLEEVDGEWLGPEQMEYLREGMHGSPAPALGTAPAPAPEMLVTPEPTESSSEQEEK